MQVKSQSASRYASLASFLANGFNSPAAMRICIVTPDLLGPVKNGGIGTACAYLAYALAKAGHDVSVLFTQDDARLSEYWTGRYTEKGIKIFLPESASDSGYFPNHEPLITALRVHDWLAGQPDFAMVIFMEWQGNGFYALHAKKCGLRFLNTALMVIIHSPSLWHSLNNAAAPANPIQSCVWHMERQAIEMADAVISPSAYMLDWCKSHGYRLPELSFVQPNLLEWPEELANKYHAPIEEIDFFGRLEYRKGLGQFCDALDILAKRRHLPRKVTFLGKCAFMGSEHCLLYIARRSRVWKNCTIQLLLHYDHNQAVKYLCDKKRLAVMPSVADNSPYTVYECLVAGIPFLARNVGGIGELVAEQDGQQVLFTDNPSDLANKLENTLGKKPFRARLDFDLHENHEAWITGLQGLALQINSEHKLSQSRELPFISVCLTHYNRPHLLTQAVDSLLAQDYQNFEVILADDGSPGLEAKLCLKKLEPVFNEKDWRILRLENSYVGRARNVATREAKGEWLLFFDDDNVAKPHMLRRCAEAAAHCDSGLAAIMFDVFEGSGKPEDSDRKERFLPSGGLVAYSAIYNTLADATALIARKSFERMGGFSEDYGLGHEDFELYLRMALAGEPMTVIPEPLFWYRREKSGKSMLQSTNAAANRMRSLRPFLEMLPAPLAELALMTHGMAVNEGFYESSSMLRETLEGYDEEYSSCPCGQDPQSAAVLAQIADNLSRQGMEKLAGQILMELENAENACAPEALKLILQAQKAAADVRVRQLRRIMGDFLALRTRQDEKTHLYAVILEHLPQSASRLRAEMLNKLKAAPARSISSHLAIARHCAEASDCNTALFHFFKALVMAENEYFRIRTDVAEAVKRGDFICALHHYALHGAKDKSMWPQKYLFQHTLKKSEALFTHLCNTHMATYHYHDSKLAQKMTESLMRK